MLEWSYEYFEQQHKKLRECRSQIARKWVETWLKQLISPYIESLAPLPPFFSGYTSGLPTPEELPDAAREIVVMAVKLGWVMMLVSQSQPMRVEIWPDDKHPHEHSGSEWDIIAVHAKKQVADANQRLAGAAQIVRSTLSGVIGGPDEIPTGFVVRKFDYAVLDKYRGQLAELGWKPVLDGSGVPHLARLPK